MAYTKYSLTPANNNAAPPDGAPEGMLPSAVNDTMRDMMAQIRDCGDGIRGGTYTMTAPVITGGSITGVSSVSTTALTSTNDASISGLTVGKGGGSVAGNTALGQGSLQGSNSGSGYNTAVGFNTLYSNTTGAYNTAVGNYNTMYANTSGSSNIAIGGGDAVANSALRFNTTGSYNVAVGIGSLGANTTASNNTAVGYQAGYSNQTGTENTFLGNKAGYAATNAYNTVIGSNAGIAFTTGVGQTLIGSYAGTAITTGGVNTFIGLNSGNAITTGSKNSILGAYTGNQGGLDIRTANNYIVLSDGDGNPRIISDSSGRVLIGTTAALNTSYSLSVKGANGGAWVQAANSGDATILAESKGTTWNFYGLNSAGTNTFYVLANGDVRNTNNSYGAISDAKLKENIVDATPKLEDLLKVKIRHYNLIGDSSKQIGVVAQELEQVFPKLVETNVDMATESNPNPEPTKSVKYSVFVPMLIKAVQELKAEVDAQALEIAQLKGN